MKNVVLLALVGQVFFVVAEEEVMHVTVTQPVTPESKAPSVETIRKDRDFCLETLHNNDTNIDALSPSGKTPLQLLTLYFINNVPTQKLMQYALVRGANVDVTDELGRTPLFFVVAYALCPEIFEQKQKEFDVTHPTPIAEVAEVPLDDVAASKNVLTAEAPTAEGKTADQQIHTSAEQKARNPLHDRAVAREVIELLLKFKADPTHTDAQGISPVLLAITVGDQEILELFARYKPLDELFAKLEGLVIVQEEASEETE